MVRCSVVTIYGHLYGLRSGRSRPVMLHAMALDAPVCLRLSGETLCIAPRSYRYNISADFCCS